MPCDTIQTNTIDLPKMNDKLLARALSALGATGVIRSGNTVSFTLRGSRYTVSGGALQSYARDVGAVADKLKVSYSREVVKYTAQRNGWAISETAPNVFAVVKGN